MMVRVLRMAAAWRLKKSTVLGQQQRRSAKVMATTRRPACSDCVCMVASTSHRPRHLVKPGLQITPWVWAWAYHGS